MQMDEIDAEYSKQLRELLRTLLAPKPVEAGLLGDWKALRRDRRPSAGYRSVAARR
jgi:hypothetical protein